MSKKAIIICDLVNEIIHSEGKFKGKGYAAYAESHKVLEHTAAAIEKADELNFEVIHVKVGFSADYKEQPTDSPLFGKAKDFQALKLETWATEFHEALPVKENHHVVTKHRVSPFYATPLESILRNGRVRDVYICGCATDLVVSSLARDCHDRDFNTFVLEDCCAAGSEQDHEFAMAAIKKIATVGSAEVLLN